MYLMICYSFFTYLLVQFGYASGVSAQGHVEELKNIFQRTEIFFTNLKSEFELSPNNATTRQLIDSQTAQFARDVEKENVNKQIKIGNEKSNHRHEQEFDTLNHIKELLKWHLPNAIDVIYISQRNENESLTLVLTLRHDGIFLLQFRHDGFIPIDSYSLANGESITVIKNFTEQDNMLVAIKKTTGYTMILDLNHDSANILKFHHIQTLITAGADSLATWYGMNRVLYLGITSSSAITIYSWKLEHYFELYQQIFNSGVKYLIPLRINETHATGFATAGIMTRIFTLNLKFNRYNLIQNLGESRDITGFNIYQKNKRHSDENFIVLVRNISIIIYKNYTNFYVPFQQLQLDMEQVHSLVKEQTVYLLFVPKLLSGKIKVFIYNEWKFVDTQMNFGSDAIEDVILPFLQTNQWHFAAKFKNRSQLTRRVLQMNDIDGSDTNWCDRMLMKSKFSGSNQSYHGDAGSMTTARVSIIQDGINQRKNELKELLKTRMSIEHISLTSLEGQNVHVLSHVSADRMKSKSINETIQNSIQHHRDENINQNYEFRNVTISSNVNYLCPIPAVNYKKIKAKGLINSVVSFESLIEDLLKLNDSICQIITGAHRMNSIETTNANISSIDIGFNLTHQNIIAGNITIDELEIISGGFFLPVNHTDVYELMGTLSVKKAKIMKSIDLHGHINGTSVTHLLPIVHYQQPIILSQHSNRHFNYIQIMESIIANDVVGFQSKHSYNLIKSNSFSLNSINIPTHMIVKMNFVDWTDVYVSDSFGNWLTIRNKEISNVTGLKMIPSTVQLNPKGHEIISVSTFENSICTLAAFIDNVHTSSVTLDRARIQKLYVDAIIGDINLDNKINIDQNGSEVNDKDQLNLEFDFTEWIRAGVLRGPIESHKLIVDNVKSYKDIVIILPEEIRRIITKKKCLIDNINGIDINKFLFSVATIHDSMIPSIDMKFIGGLEVNEIIAHDKLPINLPNDKEFNFNFGMKTVAGKIETENVNISFIPELEKFNNKDDNIGNKSFVDLIVDGNVTFMMEPRIRTMNNWKVANFFDNVWMRNQATILKGNLIYFYKMVMSVGPISIENSLNTPENNKKSWSQFRETIFSKSKIQNISQMCQLDRVYVFNDIIGSSQSRIISQLSTNLHNLEHQTFRNCKKIKGNDEKFMMVNDWQFAIINTTNLIELNGKVNNLDLNKDVVRIDVEENVITSTKTIDYLTVNNIFHYSKFNKLAKNALMTNITKNYSDMKENVIINGKKRFGTVEMMNLTVKGDIAGKKIENCIEKTKTHQYFRGQKIFKGTATTHELIIDENTSLNDIYVMNLLKYHLKRKFNGTQIILNPIIFQRGLKIFGSAKIDGWYQSLRMIDSKSWSIHKYEKSLEVSKQKIGRLDEITRTIDDVIPNRVIYWDKLAYVDTENFIINNSLLLTSLLPMKTEKLIYFEDLGDCYVGGMMLICNNNEMMMNFSSVFNTSRAIQSELMSISGVKLCAVINSAPGGVMIFSYSPEIQKFKLQIKLDVPDISHGSIEQAHNSLWIALDVGDRTIIVRYNIWNEFQQYSLPPPPQSIHGQKCNQQLIPILHSDYDEELLFVRNDGIWRIGGVSQPKRIIGNNLIECPSEDIFVINNNLYFRLINVHNNEVIFLKALCMNN